MSKTSEWDRKSKIRKGEPIEETIGENTLIFYPVTMADYEEFLDVKNAWAIRLTSLPVQYLSMPFLSALWAMEMDMTLAGQNATGSFERILRLLYLTLRLEYKREEVLIETERGNPRQLLAVVCKLDDDKFVSLTPQDFSTFIRPLVAAQNGIELPDESFNPEIVAEERKVNEMNSANLKIDVSTLISSVAYLSGKSEKEIEEWTVLQFDKRVKAIDRDKNFMLYGAAQLSGMVKFPKGNPYPSWCYDRVEGLTPALRTMNDIGEKVKSIGDVAIIGTGMTAEEQAKLQN